jgi:hypothetical protein
LIKEYCRDNKGTVLLTLLILLPLFWLLWSITLDGADAKYVARKTKTALNRAVKAAVMAVDEEQLAEGIISIDIPSSWNNFCHLLCLNLHLDHDFNPQEKSPLQEAPEVLDYYVYQGPDFPYDYHTVEGITHTFQDPGVVAVLKMKYRYNFSGRTQDILVYSAAEVKRQVP